MGIEDGNLNLPQRKVPEKEDEKIDKPKLTLEEALEKAEQLSNERQDKQTQLLKQEKAEGKDQIVTNARRQCLEMITELIQTAGEPFSDKNMGKLIEDYIEMNLKVKSAETFFGKSFGEKDVSADQLEMVKKSCAELITYIEKMKISLDRAVETPRELIENLKKLEGESEYDKFFFSMLHDRFLNEVGKISWMIADLNKLAENVKYFEEDYGKKLSGEKLKKNEEFLYYQIFKGNKNAQRSLEDIAKAVYFAKSFFANTESMMRNMDQIITENDSNVAYGEKSFRQTAFQCHMQEQSRKTKREDKESEQTYQSASLEARHMQEPWEKEFNKLEDSGIFDLIKVI